ncbi:MAG: transposase [Albidovulum sp.]|nr:transposase [Albidovulum sp.]
MSKTARGKSHREGISLTKLFKMFPDEEAARGWFESRMWPDGPYCPRCGTTSVQADIKHKTMTHRCRECDGKPRFSLKTGNIKEGSKLGYQARAIAVYLVASNLEITQKSACYLAHLLRKTFENGTPLFTGPVEADATYIGGKRKNI